MRRGLRIAAESYLLVLSFLLPLKFGVLAVMPDACSFFPNDLFAWCIVNWPATAFGLVSAPALALAVAVVAGIRAADDTAEMKLKELEGAELFFDIPLYVGLFGTVSAFLVMTFSPQSSRLIAYSSTLIGIIFSLVLRLSLQYPLRRKLFREAAAGEPGGDK